MEAAFKAADAMGDVEERRRTLSLTIEALFEIFFRVLKASSANLQLTAPGNPSPHLHLHLLISTSKLLQRGSSPLPVAPFSDSTLNVAAHHSP